MNQRNNNNIEELQIIQNVKIHGEKAFITYKKCMQKSQKSTSLNERMDILDTTIELVRFLHCT